MTQRRCRLRELDHRNQQETIHAATRMRPPSTAIFWPGIAPLRLAPTESRRASSFAKAGDGLLNLAEITDQATIAPIIENAVLKRA